MWHRDVDLSCSGRDGLYSRGGLLRFENKICGSAMESSCWIRCNVSETFEVLCSANSPIRAPSHPTELPFVALTATSDVIFWDFIEEILWIFAINYVALEQNLTSKIGLTCFRLEWRKGTQFGKRISWSLKKYPQLPMSWYDYSYCTVDSYCCRPVTIIIQVWSALFSITSASCCPKPFTSMISCNS